MKISVILTWSVSILLLMIVFCPAASASGIGISAAVSVDDAVAGGQYERIFTIHNPDNVEKYVRLGVGGTSASWVTLCEYNTDKPVDMIRVRPGSYSYVIAEIDVPSSAKTGIHDAKIVVKEAGKSLSLKLNIPVTINVGGVAVTPEIPLDPPTNDISDPEPPITWPGNYNPWYYHPGSYPPGYERPWYMG